MKLHISRKLWVFIPEIHTQIFNNMTFNSKGISLRSQNAFTKVDEYGTYAASSRKF